MAMTEEERKAKRKASSKKYYASHRTQCDKATAVWNSKNKDKAAESRKKTRAKYRDKYNATRRETYKIERLDPLYLEQCRARASQYRIDHPETCKDTARRAGKKHWAKNKDRLNEKARGICLAATEKLADSYMKRVLRQGTTLRNKDIPQDLIDLKREHIKITRILKERKQNEQHPRTN